VAPRLYWWSEIKALTAIIAITFRAQTTIMKLCNIDHNDCKSEIEEKIKNQVQDQPMMLNSFSPQPYD